MRQFKSGLVPREQRQDMRRRQRYFLDSSTRGFGHSASNRRRDVENGNLAGALDTQGSDRRRAFIEADLHGHDVLRQRRSVDLEARLVYSAIRADRNLLMQGVSQALHDAALYLAMDRARVQRSADILDDGVTQHFDVTRLGIYRNFAFVNGEDGNIDSFDEVAGSATRHRRDARSGE